MKIKAFLLALALALPLAAVGQKTKADTITFPVTSPQNPPSGQLLVQNTGSGTLVCHKPDGSSCFPAGGGSGLVGAAVVDGSTYANIQAAVTAACAASPVQSVYIPANYAGTDTFTNSCNTYVQDARKVNSEGIINVRAFGATGNSGYYPQGGMSNGSHVVSVNAVWKRGQMTAGTRIVIQGAGVAGADLDTTIASVSGGNITVVGTCATTVSGVGVWWGNDDTAAIQAAITYAHNQGGGTVYFPATSGVYMVTNVTVPAIDNSVTLKQGGIELVGGGRRQAVPIVGWGATDQTAIITVASGAHPVKVQGLGFYGFSDSSVLNRRYFGVDIAGGTEHHITDNFFGSGLYHGIRATSTFNNRIDFNRFYGPWNSCIKFISGASAVIDTRIRDNEFGICGNSLSAGWAIEQLSAGGGGSNWLYIEDNDCEGTEWQGCFYLKNVINPVVTGNRVEVDSSVGGNTVRAMVLDGSQNGWISKNEFSVLGVELKNNASSNLFVKNNYAPNVDGCSVYTNVSAAGGNAYSQMETVKDVDICDTPGSLGGASATAFYSYIRSNGGTEGSFYAKPDFHIYTQGTEPANARKQEFMDMGGANGGSVIGWGNQVQGTSNTAAQRLPGGVNGQVLKNGDRLYNAYWGSGNGSENFAWVCFSSSCSFSAGSWTGTFHYLNSDQFIRQWGTVQPAAGFWGVGDSVYNSAWDGTSGTVYKWLCTVTGNPGTWKAIFLIDPASPGALGATTPASVNATSVTATSETVNGNETVTGTSTVTGAATFNTSATVNGPTVTNSLLSSGAQKAPNQFPGNALLVWYKADDGTSCTSNGASVTTWNDSSGNSNNLTGGTTKPTCQLNVINSTKPVIRFNGSANGMLSGSALSSTAPFTAMIVYSKAVAATGGTMFDTDTSVQARLFWDSATLLRVQSSGSSPDTSALTDDGNPHVVIAQFGSTNAAWFDGVNKLSTAATTAALSQKLVVGSLNGQTGSKFTGDIAEIAIWTGTFTTSDRAALDTYIQNKYGVIVVSDYTQPITVKNSGGTVIAQIDVNGKGTLSGATTGTTTVTFSATPTFDGSVTNHFKITLTNNVTSSTLSNVLTGQPLYFQICQDGTGSRTFVWPTNVKGAVTIGTAASKCSAQSFIYDGTNAYALSTGVIDQ